MKISVIVPAFNEERVLGRSLHSIRTAAAAFEAVGWDWELIVCDNNSTDATAEIARAAGARVVFEPINQIARARNAAALHASGDWFVFVDADSEPSRDLFTDVIREIEGGRCMAGGSTIRFDSRDWRARLGARLWNTISTAATLAAGSFIFCEATAFKAVGGFSHELFVAEELELFRKLKPLARRASRSIVILRDHPLLTSSRKLRLYETREVIPFLFRSVIRPRRTCRNAEDCFAWYDGRR